MAVNICIPLEEVVGLRNTDTPEATGLDNTFRLLIVSATPFAVTVGFLYILNIVILLFASAPLLILKTLALTLLVLDRSKKGYSVVPGTVNIPVVATNVVFSRVYVDMAGWFDCIPFTSDFAAA